MSAVHQLLTIRDHIRMLYRLLLILSTVNTMLWRRIGDEL